MAQNYVNSHITREDLKYQNQMESLGFTVELSESDKYRQSIGFSTPHDPISFIKGNKCVWVVSNWIEADLVDGKYQNHKKYNSLLDFINDYQNRKHETEH